ncbi:hypothetical protein [Halorubrum salipaludis]|uniref:hypothetical protein n=1 Tax=Halorubrum salipaludis TaxID=2032630 RepID=UPI0011818CBB|nr:hypothetical protein [Halorubrum salipaludis]
MSVDRSNPVERTLYMFSRLYKRGLSHDPPAESPQILLERFNNAQSQVLAEFNSAENEETLSRSESLVDTLLHTHSEMWKATVEHNKIALLNSLRTLLNDVYQFERGEYAVLPQDSDTIEEQPSELDFHQKKQYYANNYRKRIEELKFATYGWGIHLYTEGDLLDSSVRQILEGPVTEDFGSIEEISDVFFRVRESDEIIDIWENWNMNRQLDRNFGVAFSGMAPNTWMLKFYCSILIWMVNENYNTSINSLSPEESPVLRYSERSIHIDPIIERFESYKEEYPLAEFLDSEDDIQHICDDFIEHFEEVKTIFESREREWTRTQPIDNTTTERFAEKVNSKLNDDSFRRAIRETTGITENPSVDEDQLDRFSVEGRFPRRVFVDSGIQTIFSNNFSRILQQYREFVIDNLTFELNQVSSYNAIPEMFDDIISSRDVEFIATGEREVSRVLRNNQNSNRVSNQDLNSYLEYSNVPILNILDSNFLAIIWFSEDYEYIEKSVHQPISVTSTPGENVPEWNESEMPDNVSPRDWVKVTFSYEAAIESTSQNGIILQM